MASPSEGVRTPSFSNVVTDENKDRCLPRPSFEVSSSLCNSISFDNTHKGKSMEIDSESSHSKATRLWEPGKCIPQAPFTPKYIINTTRIGDQTQYMKDHALIGKFLGLWPYEKDLVKWIQHWWWPMGHYDL
jgi:hypothetical protein